MKRPEDEEMSAKEGLPDDGARFRLLVESVRDYAIFLLDPGGHVRSWNLGAERMKGYKAPEIIGRHFSVFYPEEDIRAGKTEWELEIASREGRFEDEGWRVRKDGSRFWANVVITALRDPSGELVGFGKVTRDLTERRRMEEDRLRLARAEEAIRLRDEFLSIASHELKTPLTALQLLLDDLVRMEGHGDVARRRLERARRSSYRLSALVDTLLDVSRIATGRLELRPEIHDLSEVAREVTDRLHDAAVRQGCTLSLHAPRPAQAVFDRIRVEQALVNLLSNAMKYGAGAPVDVRVEGDDATVQLTVCDRGPGVPQSDRNRIFERFERAVSMRNYGGMGLGLYVTREIVEAHGGEITLTDRPDGGSCFGFRLPRRLPAA